MIWPKQLNDNDCASDPNIIYDNLRKFGFNEFKSFIKLIKFN